MVTAYESIVKAATEDPEANIIFYLSNKQYPLIGFACRDENGNILIIQAKTRQEHTANEGEIANVENDVGGLMLFYFAPCQFGKILNYPRQAEDQDMPDL